jgi:Family of unknown function (DUF6516)
MTIPAEYVLQLKTKLAISSIVASFNMVEEKVWLDKGYVRIRIALNNGDFLEAAEYFVLQDDDLTTRRYRYQWMDKKRRKLRKRWDNVENYPDLSNFPDHIHIGKEENVEPGESLSIIQLLDVLAGEISIERS